MNFTRPQLAIELQPIKKAFIDAKSRGVQLRYLTEITKDNISFCKELISVVDELRHLDGIKGNFMVSESEYLAPIILFEKGKIASEADGWSICSGFDGLLMLTYNKGFQKMQGRVFDSTRRGNNARWVRTINK